MKKGLLKWFIAMGAVLVFMTGSAWADGHRNGGHNGGGRGGYHGAPQYHGGHGPHGGYRHNGHHYRPQYGHHHGPHCGAPCRPQYVHYQPVYYTNYYPQPVGGFLFSATISEPGFAFGFAAGR